MIDFTIETEIEGDGPLGLGTRLREVHRGPGGKELPFNVHGQPGGAMRLLQPLLKVGLKRQFSEHLANLKRVLEHG